MRPYDVYLEKAAAPKWQQMLGELSVPARQRIGTSASGGRRNFIAQAGAPTHESSVYTSTGSGGASIMRTDPKGNVLQDRTTAFADHADDGTMLSPHVSIKSLRTSLRQARDPMTSSTLVRQENQQIYNDAPGLGLTPRLDVLHEKEQAILADHARNQLIGHAPALGDVLRHSGLAPALGGIRKQASRPYGLYLTLQAGSL